MAEDARFSPLRIAPGLPNLEVHCNLAVGIEFDMGTVHRMRLLVRSSPAAATTETASVAYSYCWTQAKDQIVMVKIGNLAPRKHQRGFQHPCANQDCSVHVHSNIQPKRPSVYPLNV